MSKRYKKYRKEKPIYFLMVSLITLLIYVGVSYSIKEPVKEEKEDTEEKEIVNNEELLKVHYIDVGQGDSIFIELPNNETMLIDAGEQDKGDIVSDYIKTLGYNEIDYLVGSHPHSDHIGGLVTILDNFTIKNIYMPKAVSNSTTYKKLLQSIKDKGLSVKTAKKGVKILNNDKLDISIISPEEKDYKELNDYSAVIKITYGNNTFLFMGDAEKIIENEITDDVKADVIKVAHHGSTTSSSPKFVNEVNPKYAIISVGENNKYGHPNKYVLKRWETKATVYRTDINGTIIVKSDGNNIVVNPTRKEE